MTETEKIDRTDLLELKLHNSELRRIEAELAKLQMAQSWLTQEQQVANRARVGFVATLREKYHLGPDDALDLEGSILRKAQLEQPSGS